jgi:hypothetical protein
MTSQFNLIGFVSLHVESNNNLNKQRNAIGDKSIKKNHCFIPLERYNPESSPGIDYPTLEILMSLNLIILKNPTILKITHNQQYTNYLGKISMDWLP